MWFSSKTKGTSVALIDISSSGVGGALVRLEAGKLPALCYTVREPLEVAARAGTEALTNTALRALETVGDRLVREGAPALRAAVGEGSVDRVLVSFGSPWQEASVATKTALQDSPFTFTRSFAVDMLGQSDEEPQRNVTRIVIASLLNGYLTADPYGKRAKRAEIIVLSTSLDETIMDPVEEILRKSFHTHDIRYASFTEPSFRALQELYPHEKDFLLMTVTNEATEAASVKRGHLMDAGTIACGSHGFTSGLDSGKVCADELSGLLREFAARHALPRTIFILAEDAAAEQVKTALNDPSLHALWLSDVPVSAISIQPSQFSAVVRTQGLAEGDSRLAALALAAARQA
ncbi:MAG: hypothetical protein QOE22_753 [Candidatus Parcubacteria bacterium]|jgi:hypothetical protein|nr:hypothetical protein [Candidatus Parcubacteria bacterium]